jgi:hypothetical protein
MLGAILLLGSWLVSTAVSDAFKSKGENIQQAERHWQLRLEMYWLALQSHFALQGPQGLVQLDPTTRPSTVTLADIASQRTEQVATQAWAITQRELCDSALEYANDVDASEDVKAELRLIQAQATDLMNSIRSDHEAVLTKTARERADRGPTAKWQDEVRKQWDAERSEIFLLRAYRKDSLPDIEGRLLQSMARLTSEKHTELRHAAILNRWTRWGAWAMYFLGSVLLLLPVTDEKLRGQ